MQYIKKYAKQYRHFSKIHSDIFRNINEIYLAKTYIRFQSNTQGIKRIEGKIEKKIAEMIPE